VGLGPIPFLTHWATLANFIPQRGNPNTSGFAWHELNSRWGALTWPSIVFCFRRDF
jgi:hypothetical protein